MILLYNKILYDALKPSAIKSILNKGLTFRSMILKKLKVIFKIQYKSLIQGILLFYLSGLFPVRYLYLFAITESIKLFI